MALHADYTESTTGRFCSICDETWHEPYAHKSGLLWHIPASDGKYRLVWNGACGCPGFMYRGNCRHAALATSLERAGKTHDLAHATWLRYEQVRWPEDPTIDDLLGSIG